MPVLNITSISIPSTGTVTVEFNTTADGDDINVGATIYAIIVTGTLASTSFPTPTQVTGGLDSKNKMAEDFGWSTFSTTTLTSSITFDVSGSGDGDYVVYAYSLNEYTTTNDGTWSDDDDTVGETDPEAATITVEGIII